MATINRFEDLNVRKAARVLSNTIHLITAEGLFAKDFDLKNQINAFAGSVMDNIAEGFERGGRKEFIQFLIIAKGSAGETRSQLYRALDRGYINQETFDKLYLEVIKPSKMLNSFINYLKGTAIEGH
jgi:four helix bundle protein